MSRSTPANTSLPGTRPAGANDEAAAAQQVREMFSRIAPRYDLLNHVLSMRFDVAWRKRLARRFRVVLTRSDARVLDLCCGTGDLALALAAEAKRGATPMANRVLAADFAHPMLLRAKEKAQLPGGEFAVEFFEADALHVPCAGETFDLVTAAFGFRNLANYQAGLRELYRILRPGGSLAILDFAEPKGALLGRLYRFYFRRILPLIGGLVSGNRKAYGYLPNSVSRFPPPSELARLMEVAGFREVTFEPWTGGIVAVHIGRR
jgi:demethylmenaquinone methyltransferase / 2-methoxy-6-polyprenyl-1,4-benzoquinol methylase